MPRRVPKTVVKAMNADEVLNDVRISQGGRPLDYVDNVRRRIRDRKSSKLLEFSLSGLEGAILVVCDTANLLVQLNVASIQKIDTGLVSVQSRYDSSLVQKKMLQISMIERRVEVGDA